MHQKNQLLHILSPVVKHGLGEINKTSPSHAMYEVAAMSYLMGKGYDWPTAKQIVESYEDSYAAPIQPIQIHGTHHPHYTYTYSMPHQTLPQYTHPNQYYSIKQQPLL